MQVRVLHVTPSLVPYGAERVTASLAHGMDRERFETTVVSLFGAQEESLGPVLEQDGIRVMYLNKRPGIDLRMLGRFTRVIDEIRPHVVHTSNYVLRYTLLPSLRHGVPVLVHTLQNVAEREVDLAGRMLQRWAFRSRVHPVSIAEEVSESFERTYALPRPTLIPNAIEVDRYTQAKATRAAWRRKEGLGPDDLLFVCVARLDRQKNHGALLDAFAAGPARHPASKLLLAGDGPMRNELEQRAKHLKIGDRVLFLGRREDISTVLGAADVFTLASLWEGNPLSVMEAMAAGLPVVATAVGGVPELMEHGCHGFLPRAGDVPALASGLLALAQDPAMRRSMGDAAGKRARERFDRHPMIRAYEDLYERLLAPAGISQSIGNRRASVRPAPEQFSNRGNTRGARSSGMNIAFVLTRADALGGATVHVRDLACGLESLGHHVVVLVGGRGEVLEDFEQHGVEYRILRWLGRPIHPVKDALAVAELRRVLVELNPDLVCTHTAKAGLVGRLAAALAGIPALYTPHGWSIGDRVSTANAWMFRAAERAVAPLSKSIINVCEAERSLARHHRITRDSRLAVIHNGVRDIDAALQADSTLSPARVLMVARFDPPKDHATLLTAAAALEDIPWTLELLGSGPGRTQARALAGQLGLTSRILFTNSGTDVARRLADAQLFVLASRSEGFPLSILEAMRAGLPVIASDVGGVREAVVDGETGFIVKPGDSAALSEALRLLISDSTLRLKFGRAGRRRYELHFTFEQMIGETLSLYESVLSSRLSTRLIQEAVSGRS